MNGETNGTTVIEILNPHADEFSDLAPADQRFLCWMYSTEKVMRVAKHEMNDEQLERMASKYVLNKSKNTGLGSHGEWHWIEDGTGKVVYGVRKLSTWY